MYESKIQIQLQEMRKIKVKSISNLQLMYYNYLRRQIYLKYFTCFLFWVIICLEMLLKISKSMLKWFFYTKRAYLNELDGNRHIFLLINDTSTMKYALW